MKVSVVIPVKLGAKIKALESLKLVTYPPELFEVMIAYGSLPSAQRNLAAKLASGDILYFLDDDSQVAPDFLETVVKHYCDEKVVAVGGPSLTPLTDSDFQRALGVLFSSLVGGGGVRNRYRKYGEIRHCSDNELILCNLSFRRDTYLTHDGLDERLYPNEENELMDRLVHEGCRLVHDPKLAVFRSQRRNYKAFVRQMFGYGRGRGEQTLISGKVKFSPLLPSCFLIYLLSLLIFNSICLFLPLLAYITLISLASILGACSNKDLLLLPKLILLYPTMHLLYGAGVITGLLQPRFRCEDRSKSEIEVKIVKRFDDLYCSL